MRFVQVGSQAARFGARTALLSMRETSRGPLTMLRSAGSVSTTRYHSSFATGSSTSTLWSPHGKLVPHTVTDLHRRTPSLGFVRTDLLSHAPPLLSSPSPLYIQRASFATDNKDVRKDSEGEEDKSENTSRVTKVLHWLRDMPHNFMEELRHYWSGTKLLGYEIRICYGNIRKITRGEKLTRREHRQLVRTATDLLRLVPFAFFLIIPFMEFALPVVLKIFPNMLPSTFHSKHKREEQSKKELKAKIEMAKFLQEALYTRTPTLSSDDKAVEFKSFMEKVRAGVAVDNQQILRFASLFEDEFTLDQLSREQLVAMSKYMQLNTIGTDAFLRYQLNRKITQLKNDDRVIESEGLENLTLVELQQACEARGLKATSRSSHYLRERLREWLDLSIKQNLPGSLLILANAFKITGTTSSKDALRDAMYHLPEAVVDDIRLKIAEDEGSLSKELKLRLLQREEEQIEEDKREGDATEEQIKFKELQEWIGKEKDIAQSSVSFSASQLKAITEAVADLAVKSTVAKERRQLQDLKVLLEKRKNEMTEFEEEEERKREAKRKEAEEEQRKKEENAASERIVDPAEKERLEREAKEKEEASKEEEKQEAEKEAEREEEEKKRKENYFRVRDKLANYVDTLQNRVEEIETKDIHLMLGLDQNCDGYVDLKELQEATKSYQAHLPDDLVDHVLRKLDADNDDRITLEEFRQLALKHSSQFEDIVDEAQKNADEPAPPPKEKEQPPTSSSS